MSATPTTQQVIEMHGEQYVMPETISVDGNPYVSLKDYLRLMVRLKRYEKCIVQAKRMNDENRECMRNIREIVVSAFGSEWDAIKKEGIKEE